MSGSDFERDLVNAFNRFFEEHRMDSVRRIPEGIAFRDTQHEYADQKLDVFVDNPDLGIECKSVKKKKKDSDYGNTNKLYFSSHFSEKDMGAGGKVHQIETISEFLFRSDREGFLALRVSMGRGSSPKGYLIDWAHVKDLYYDEDCSGIDVRELDEKCENSCLYHEIPRRSLEDSRGQTWVITKDLWEKIKP